MNTNTNTNMDAVQELKSEWVQKELAAQEPLVIYLKSEWVQEPEALSSGGPEVVSSRTYELMVNPCEKVAVSLHELQMTIYLDGLKVG